MKSFKEHLTRYDNYTAFEAGLYRDQMNEDYEDKSIDIQYQIHKKSGPNDYNDPKSVYHSKTTMHEKIHKGKSIWHDLRAKHLGNRLKRHYNYGTPDENSAMNSMHARDGDNHATHLMRYSNESDHLNRALHNGHTLDHKQQRHVDGIDAALRVHKSPKDMHVYTGLRRSPDQHHKPGEDHIHLHMKGYTSATLHPQVAQRFTQLGRPGTTPSILKIHVPKGSHGGYINHVSVHEDEHEFLLHRNARLHVHPKPSHVRNEDGHKIKVWHAKLVHDGVKDVG